MDQQQLINVFEDTKVQVNSGELNSVATTGKYILRDIEPQKKNKWKTRISIENTDSVSAAQKLALLGKTGILNMASPIRPGGGVKKGSKAQEECLFRCSDLFLAIPERYYPLDNDEGLYTNNALFFKDFEYKNITPFLADVITVAAINLNPLADVKKVENYTEVTTEKVRLILQLAAENNCENLVLGAWGCGVFKNDPQTIANLFMEELKEYTYSFNEVLFAVINDHNSVANNYEIFEKVVTKA